MFTDTPTYHKIQSVFKRDPDNGYKTFLFGEFAEPEFEYLYENKWVGTEKVDGTNCRIHVHNDVGFTVGGRTDNAQLHRDLLLHLNEVGENAVSAGLEGLTLYGEGYGAGIQKGGGDYRQDKAFILFDVMITDSNMFLEHKNIINIADQLGIPCVPTIYEGTLKNIVQEFTEQDAWVEDSALRATGSEGMVFRPLTELRSRRGQRVITKLKVKDFG